MKKATKPLIIFIAAILISLTWYAIYYLGNQFTELSTAITNTSLSCNNLHENVCTYALTLSKAIDLSSFDFINIVLSILTIFIVFAGFLSFFYYKKVVSDASEATTKEYLDNHCQKLIEQWLKSDMGSAKVNDAISLNISENNATRNDAMENFVNTASPEESEAIIKGLDDPKDEN